MHSVLHQEVRGQTMQQQGETQQLDLTLQQGVEAGVVTMLSLILVAMVQPQMVVVVALPMVRLLARVLVRVVTVIRWVEAAVQGHLLLTQTEERAS